MATSKTRITISLSDHTHQVISELARLQKRPKSAIVSEMMDTSAPVLERVCMALQAAEMASTTMRSSLAGSLSDSQQKVEGFLAESLDIFDEAIEPLERSQSNIPPEEAYRFDLAEELPPHSNTGVTIGDNSEKSRKNKKKG